MIRSQHSSNHDSLELIAATLERAWADQEAPEKSRWMRQWPQPNLAAPKASAAVREAQRDGLRFSSRRRGKWLQFVAGSVLTRWPMTRLLQRQAFMLGHPDAAQVLILPGNRRVRVLNFATGRAQSIMKLGYVSTPIVNEVETRLRAPEAIARGLMLPILKAQVDGTPAWLEEPLIEGWALPRCPPHIGRAKIAATLVARLWAWQQAQEGEGVAAADYAKGLVQRLAGARNLCSPRALIELELQASALGEVRLCLSHGDLQPGNLMIERRGALGRQLVDAIWIDWEYAGWRYEAYDLLSWGLQPRYGQLREKLRAFVEDGPQGPSWKCVAPHLPLGSKAWRRAAAALFELEELRWIHEDQETRAVK